MSDKLCFVVDDVTGTDVSISVYADLLPMTLRLSADTKSGETIISDVDMSCLSDMMGGGSVQPGTGLVEDNGTIRLALLQHTSYGHGQIALNISSQYNTPYSYDDDEDVYEDNPTPYVIDLSQNVNKFNAAALNIGKFAMTQAQVDALKPDLKSVFIRTHWTSGVLTELTYVIPSSSWSSNGFSFIINIPSRSSSYPSAEIFDTIESIDLTMTTSTNTSHPYGYNIGTYFPAGTNIYVNGSYWG